MKERAPVESLAENSWGLELVTIILPTFNEANNIVPLVNRIHSALSGINKEILVVDDDSPDRTWELAQQIKDKDVKVIRRTENRGLVQSLQQGITESKGTYVAWMDADQSMPPESIPALLKELKTYDVAIGSRYVRGGKDLRPIKRALTSRMINLAANLILNFKVLDWTTGFVAAKKTVLQQVPLQNSVYGEYCIEFLYTANERCFKIKEVPYLFVDRLEGESKTAAKLSSLLQFGWVYGKKILTLRFGRS